MLARGESQQDPGAPAPFELPVWSGAAPGSPAAPPAEAWQERGKGGVVDRAVRLVHTPTIEVYLAPKPIATGTALLIAPGGGYEHVTIDKEGNDIARWYSAHGVAGIVLKYRLPHTPGNVYTIDTALADARQALIDIRTRAGDWGLDPARLGMIGFSSGGNLTALTAIRLPKEERPAFLGLMYAGLPKDFGPFPDDIPPAFILQADDDAAGTDGSVRFYEVTRERHVASELHLFSLGGHGFGLGQPGSVVSVWPDLFLQWLNRAKARSVR